MLTSCCFEMLSTMTCHNLHLDLRTFASEKIEGEVLDENQATS